ncbi:hypothetical protein [Longimicrobium sp.]|uniref:hypothetical protein n=1 Tax=Longimicrobium sp. TaxID=2029185 RepID=UPI002E36377D|nr:hypothetical protein [Longimicrobium sp.]HEX6039417.1 hypothetical protein [Longimicrobium sp.]
MIWSLLGTLAGLGFILWALANANRPRAVRHRQAWAPVLAFLVTAVLVYALLRVGGPLGREWARWTGEADRLLARSGIRIRAGAAISLAVNLFILSAWLVLKRVVNTVLALLERWMRGFGVFPAYDEHPEQGVVLKAEWIYPGMLFRAAGWTAGVGFLVLTVISALVTDIPFIALPHLPALATILLLETGWYLGGQLPVEEAGGVRGHGVLRRGTGDYTALWEEYQRVWPDHVLAASSAVRLAPTPAAAIARPRLPDEGDETQQAVTGAWHDLVAAGHPLSDAHYHVLDQLWRGRDVLLTEADYAGTGPVLFAFMQRVLVDGHTVLVLLPSGRRADPAACDEVEAWIRDGLHGASGGGTAWSLARFDAYQQRSAVPDVLIAAPEELLGRGVTQEPWFTRLHAVVLLEGARTVFEAPLRTDALMRVLRHRRPGLQQVVLSGDRAALESSLRDNLAGNPGEHRPPRPAPESAFAVVWSLESLPAGRDGRFQDRVLLGSAGADLGAEMVLALPAWRDQVLPLYVVDQEGLPWAEYVEELENHRAGLMNPVPASALAGSAHETVRVPALPHLLPRRERAFVLARDRDHNLVTALRTWLPLGTESAFVHVVAPPYLLRDYLAANLEYFAQAPLLALAPRIADSRLVVALTLLERLTTGALTEHEVLRELRAVLPGAAHVEEAMARLFRDVLGIDPVELNLLDVRKRTRYDEGQDAFVDELAYRLSPGIREYEALAWLRRFRIVDRGEHELGWIEQDRLYQSYLPGQVHAFQGKPFRVEWVDADSGIVWVDHDTAGEYAVYRPVRRVDLTAVRASEQRAHQERRVTGGWAIEAALCRGAYRVRTSGYYAFTGDVRLADGAGDFTELGPDQVPERGYADGRMLRLRFTPLGPLNARGRDRLADTLAVLFQEAFRTLFPETHPFLLACAPGSADRWAGTPLRALMPLLGADPDPPVAEAVPDGQTRGAPIVLYFLEDAHAPLGLVLSLFDRRADVLALLEDHLAWVVEDEGRTEESWRRPKLERDRYLRFGGETPLAGLDLPNAHAVLHSLLQGRNPRRDERRAFFRGERGGMDAGAQGTRQCDFCGRMMPDADFERLDDGRERCADCRRTAVDSVDALKRVFKEGRQFLVQHLGEKIRRDVDVEFASAAQVMEAAGKPFMPTKEFDIRSMGIARRDGNDFAVLVENGQPYHTTLAVIVHELTHIWQFTYLDYERMQQEHGLLLTEGHAQWAALTCLRRRGLAPEWVDAEERRDDEYGHGYRLIQEYERRHAHLGDVFDILLHLYPAK